MIWITILFALFLFVLIVLADLGKLNFLLWAMNDLPFGDKVVHFLLIGTLSFLVNRTAMQLFPRKGMKYVSVIVTLFLLVLFTLEEISQAPIAGRDASLGDLLANYAGIIIFALLANLTRNKQKTLPL